MITLHIHRLLCMLLLHWRNQGEIPDHEIRIRYRQSNNTIGSNNHHREIKIPFGRGIELLHSGS